MLTACFFQANQFFHLQSIYILNNDKTYFKYLKRSILSQMIVTTAFSIRYTLVDHLQDRDIV